MKNNNILAPSLLSFPIENWNRDFGLFTDSGIDTIHFDVMDPRYVGNTAFNEQDFQYFLQHNHGLVADVHLMVCDPLTVMEHYFSNQTRSIAFHFDVLTNKAEVIQGLHKIQSQKIKAGIAINPNFSMADIEPYLTTVDFVLVMGVFPGRGGQAFIDSTLKTVDELYNYRLNHRPDLLIQIDGGMNHDTIPLVHHHTDLVVAGSFLAKHLDELPAIKSWFDQLA
ncbi:ribulose-phosphate 3-epimerase [Ureaplasma ceti]|uniref:Ribulose-phosphate 3-epimerase n=1 Tax=Ureaplasma ceti TaxID=3119530 RepID=A0ABP9U586_9BACT